MECETTRSQAGKERISKVYTRHTLFLVSGLLLAQDEILGDSSLGIVCLPGVRLIDVDDIAQS